MSEVYLRFGFFKERMVSVTLKGKDGMEQIKSIMNRFRENPPSRLLGSEVVLFHDYKKRETVDLVSDLRYEINLPESDVLQFVCADNTVVTIRPSGTEPKIKYYYGVRTEIPSEDQYEVKCRTILRGHNLVKGSYLLWKKPLQQIRMGVVTKYATWSRSDR